MSQDWEWDVFLLSDKKQEQHGYDPIDKNTYIQMYIWNVQGTVGKNAYQTILFLEKAVGFSRAGRGVLCEMDF